MSFNDFVASTVGAITAGVFILVLVLLFALNLYKSKSLSVKTLTYSAISIALAMVLSNIKLLDMPYGGTVTACSMLFVSFIGYWFGLGAGLIAAVSYGLLQLIIEPYVVHPMQLLLDYPLAFGALGLSGLFSKSKYGLYKGYILGSLARWFFSTLSGIIFFAEYAGDMHPVIYSSLYNIFYIAPEMALSLLIISIPAFKNAIGYVKEMAGAQRIPARG